MLAPPIPVLLGLAQVRAPLPLVCRTYPDVPPAIVTLPTLPKLAVLVAIKLFAVRVVVVLLYLNKVSPPNALPPSLN